MSTSAERPGLPQPPQAEVVLCTADVFELGDALGFLIHRAIAKGVDIPTPVRRLFERIAVARVELVEENRAAGLARAEPDGQGQGT